MFMYNGSEVQLILVLDSHCEAGLTSDTPSSSQVNLRLKGTFYKYGGTSCMAILMKGVERNLTGSKDDAKVIWALIC